MTPEQLTALLGGIGVVLTALAALIVQVMTVRSELGKVLQKSEAIEHATNGTLSRTEALREALVARIETLESRLAESTATAAAAAVASAQAASDVRAAIKSQEPPETEAR